MYKRQKGTQDIYGERQAYKTLVKKTIEGVVSFYNFKEIETPIFETIDLFKRTVGETSDIVSKEMYSFEDKKGRSLALRPEGTAGVVRAFVENKLFSNSQPIKLFYQGPMFRYERPQKGRQRQFTQFGVELLGIKSPAADAEIIMMANQILQTLKLTKTKLLLNSLGDKETRDNYSKALKKYLLKFKDDLSEVSVKRLDTNPLRILDDKVDSQKDFMRKAPKLKDFLSKDSQIYLKGVCDILEGAQIKYEISDKLVRGLDYYSEVVFEFVSETSVAGSQSTLIAGGRYDNMVKNFGGPEMSGMGWALGVERIVNEVEALDIEIEESIDVYVINLENELTTTTSAITNMLRAAGFIVDGNFIPMKLSKAFDKAASMNAKLVLIAGKKDLEKGMVAVKDQRDGRQDDVKIEELIEYLDKKVGV